MYPAGQRECLCVVVPVRGDRGNPRKHAPGRPLSDIRELACSRARQLADTVRSHGGVPSWCPSDAPPSWFPRSGVRPLPCR